MLGLVSLFFFWVVIGIICIIGGNAIENEDTILKELLIGAVFGPILFIVLIAYLFKESKIGDIVVVHRRKK